MKKLGKKIIEDIFALTPMQEGMLFRYLKDPGSDYYFEQLSLEISGEINIELFEKAWNFVIKTNEMLRAVFRWEKVDNPVQIILKEHRLRPRYCGFPGKAANDVQNQLAEIKVKDRENKFDLQGVPFRVTLCKVGDDKYEMIISSHHILYDGWSNGIILKEFSRAYRESSQGVVLSPLVKPAFKEFVKWMRTQDTAKQEEYWNEYLKGFFPAPDRVVTRERKKRQELKHTCNYKFKFPGELKRKLDVFIKGHNITTASFLYSLWGVLLQNYHAADDIIFAATVSGRSASAAIKGIENIVGLFINTLPLRIQTLPTETVSGFISRNHRMLRHWSEFENSAPLPVREILDKCRKQSLFDSVVVIENYPLDSLTVKETAPLSLHSFSIVERTFYDLTVIITTLAGIEFNITYDNDRFDPTVISRLSHHLISIAAEMVTHPGKVVSEIDVWEGEEREKFLELIRTVRETEPGVETGYTAPRDELEKKLVEVWSNILNIKQEEIGIDDNFFDFGGHSLKASQSVSRIHRVFEVKVPLAEIFHRPTIRELAGFIRDKAKQEYIPLPLVEGKEYYDVSPGQGRLYMLQQLNPGSTAYNGPWSMMLDGPIDEERIKQSFKRLIERHEMLRTSFEQQDGEPVQKIHEHAEFEIEYYEIKEVKSCIKSFTRPFNLSQAPLLRVGLIKLEPRKHILVMDMHHIITDGTSSAVLAGELSRLYRGEDLPPLKLQYKDFSQWRNRRTAAEKLKKQEEYWLQHLSGELPVLNLPIDYPRPQMQRFDGERILFELDDVLAGRLHILMKETGTTLYMSLMSILNIVLGWYCDREDIVVGTPIAGRNHADIENTVGFFLETLAIRNRPGADKTFTKFLHEVKNATLNAYENRDYPFSLLIKRLSPTNDMSRNPLFDVMLNVLNQSGMDFELEGVNVVPFESDIKVSKVDITLEAVEHYGKIRFELEYCTALFKRQTMERFGRYFLNTLRETIFKPGIRLGEIEIIEEDEKRQILAEFNNTAGEYDEKRTVVDYFKTCAAGVPDRIAVVGPPAIGPITYGQISYRELDNRSEQIASRLREKGAAADTIVGIMLVPSLEMITGIWGILKAGGAYLPIDPEYPEERINYMLADSGTQILVSDHLPLAARNLFEKRFLDFQKLLINRLPVPRVKKSPPIDTHLAYLIYTSGSTGRPKGVMVRHKNLLGYIRSFQEEFKIKETDVVMQQASISFDVFVEEVYPCLLAGGTLAVPPRQVTRDTALLVDFIATQKITIIDCSPLLLNELNGWAQVDKSNPLKTLHTVISGGDVLKGEYVTNLLKTCVVYNTYGPTETTVCASYHRLTGREGAAVPIGKPITNYRVYILDGNLRLLPPGVVGEIVIGGVGVTAGYLNRPGLTAEKFDQDLWDLQDYQDKEEPFGQIINAFVEGEAHELHELTRIGATSNQKFLRGSRGRFLQKEPPGRRRLYKSGDLGRWLPDGSIEFIGRKDRQVKIRGYRIELGEIETRLLALEGIKEVSVISIGEHWLCAYFTARKEKNIKEMRQFLSRDIPSYMIPAYFVQLEQMPIGPGGKIDIKALPKPGEYGLDTGVEYVLPESEIENKLVNFWQELLERERIGIMDDFFELGGDSILVNRCIARIREELHAEIPLREFFEKPFIKALAEEIQKQERQISSIKPAKRIGEIPLSFAQERLWFLQELDAGNVAYFVPRVIRMKGKLEVNLLERTFTEIIRRHEILRTVFPDVDGQLVQRIQPPYPFKIPVLDWRRLEKEEQEKRVSQFLHEEGQRPFDLKKGPLLRVNVLKLTQKEHIFVLTEHHLIHDGWTQGVLLNEIITIFSAYLQGRNHDLPELPIQYADYAVWQRDFLKGDVLERHLTYWKEKLSGLPPVLNLPGDRPRPPVISGQGEMEEFRLPGSLTQALKKYSRQDGATLFMTMLAVFKILLYRYTGAADLCVGTGIANRRYKEMEGMLGMVINTLPLRTQVEGVISFKQCLSRVKETCLEAYQHEDTPFGKIVGVIQPERSLSYSPLFQAIFTFMDTPGGELALPGLELELLPTHNRSAKFDLNIVLIPPPERETDETGEMLIEWEYNTDIFNPPTILRMISHYKRLLEECPGHPGTAISTLPLLSAAEIKQVLYEFNDTEVDFPKDKTIHRLFEEQASRTPDHIAAEEKTREKTAHQLNELNQITYRELNERVNRLAQRLRNIGIRSDEPPGILMERSLAMMESILAVWKAGGAYIPLSIKWPMNRITSLLNDSHMRILLTTANSITDENDEDIEFYREIGSNTRVEQVIYLDKQYNLERYHHLFRTFKFSSFLSGGNSTKIKKDMIFQYQNETLNDEEFEGRLSQIEQFVTYREIDWAAPTAVMFNNPIYNIIALSFLKKHQIPFVVIDPSLGRKGKSQVIKEYGAATIFSQCEFLDELDQLLWELKDFKNLILLDNYDSKKSVKQTYFRDIWNYVAEETSEAINDYGWTSSYTNESFTIEEMQQHIHNFKVKLQPYLNRESRVFEIGCGHGLVLFEIAQAVKYYLAADPADSIIEKNKRRLQREGITNAELKTLAASEIGMLVEKDFDVILCSSVIHYFPNTIYLEEMITNSIALMKDKGIIYLDDIMDLGKKDSLVQSMSEYKKLNPYAQVKMNWDTDLFVHTDFFHYLKRKYPAIVGCEISKKLGHIKNELTKFRYDVILKVDKKADQSKPTLTFEKNIYTGKDIEEYSRVGINKIKSIKKDNSYEILEIKEIPQVEFNFEVTDITTVEMFSKENPGRGNHPSDLAYVIYTSGSTGKPKGAMVKHIGMMNHIDAKVNDLQLSKSSVVAQNASHTFDISVWQFFAALTRGGKTVIYPDEVILNPDRFISRLIQDQTTILEVVPSYLSVILSSIRKENFSLLSLEHLLVTGEEVKPHLVKQWFAICPGIKMVNAYGPTEASDDITHNIMEKAPETERIPIGKPLQNFNIYIIDENMNLCPIGLKGEICVAGIGVGRGYLNEPQRTAEKFIMSSAFRNPFEKGFPDLPNRLLNHFSLPTSNNNTLYRTGDIGKWLPDGSIEFFGRMDYQVKIRGFRIELEEIEKQILNHEYIKEAVVIDKEDKQGNKCLCAYITGMEKSNIPGLKDHLSKRLPGYMVPAFFLVLDKIPLTPNGKINRSALPDPEGVNLKDDGNYIPPSNDVEKKLVEIWEKVLGKDKIGVDDNLFMIGGDSIKAIQIISRLSSAGYKLEMRDLFRYPVISELASHIKKLNRTPEQDTITGTIPLTPIQETFFDESYGYPHYYNQAVMLFSRKRFDKEAIKQVFSRIQEHHDALRITYERNEESGKVIQVNHGLDFPLSLQEFDLKNHENNLEELNTKINEIQASIDLEKGPLMKLGLFHLKDGDRLLIVIHHLVIDGVSWQILLEDIETLYSRYKQGKKLVLPPKTDSFKLWSVQLSEYANSKTFLKEKTYWQKIESVEAPPIPKDFDVDNNYINGAVSVSFTLSEEETENLLTKVNDSFRTEITDILLTALGMTIKKTFRQDRVLVALEHYGREQVLEEMDIGRTIGWFTSVYPVLMDVSYAGEPGRQIKEIKETLRRIPNKGSGHGILKYLTREENKKEIEFKLKPPIGFNYLGQFHADIKQKSSFEIAKESTGNCLGLNSKREYLLDVSGLTANNRLTMTISYNKTHFRPGTIVGLVENFESALTSIIALCGDKENIEPTPSDFTYKGLSIENIDRLMTLYPNLEDLYTLTPMQEGMLFHALVDDRSYSYFEQISYRLQGELNVNLVEKGLNELFKRHDILRTVFLYKDIEPPVQVVLKERNVDFYYEDISKIGEREEKEDFISEFKAKDKERGFDLTKGSLMRLAIIELDKFEYDFTWSFHHILMDGWCIGILNTEFFEIYNGYLENRPYRLPVVKPYRTYIQWLEKQDKNASAEYWENYLDLYEEQTGVPRTRRLTKEENQSGYRNETVSLVLNTEKTAGLNKLAAGNHVTLNTVIQALWGTLLRKYNGKEDVVFGAVVSGRPYELEGVESMVGLFINTIPVRIRFEEKMKFYRLLRQVQEEALASEPHHFHPLAEIQSISLLKQNLIDHLFIFENFPIAEQIERYGSEKNNSNKISLKIKNVEIFEQTNYDFNVILGGSDRLKITFLYNGNVYNGDFVKSISKHFCVLVDQVIEKEELQISALTLLSQQEKNLVLSVFNNTGAGYPKDKTIQQLFEEQVEQRPNQVAVVGNGEGWQGRRVEGKQQEQPFGKVRAFGGNITITYRELNNQSTWLARILTGKGVKPDIIVGIMMERSLEMIIGLLGILKAGGAYLPIDPNYPQERIYYMLVDSGTNILLTTADLPGKFEKLSIVNCQLFIISEKSHDRRRLNTPPIETTFNLQPTPVTCLAYAIYTSGSTGKPKGTLVQHRSLLNRLNWMQHRYPLGPNDVILQKTTFTFDVSVWELFWWSFQGASLFLLEPGGEKNPAAIVTTIARHRITTMHFVPSMLNAFLGYLESPATQGLNLESLKSLKLVFASGEALLPDQVQRFNTLLNKIMQTRLINLYGPTEATVDVSYFDCPGHGQQIPTNIPIGKPIENICLYVLDKDMCLQPVGIPGELYITGIGTARGYLNTPELTAGKFIEYRSHRSYRTYISYKTGDLARWLADGNIEFLGRMDFQVKIRGFRIELGEIENRLMKHPQVKEAVVIDVETNENDKSLCAYLKITGSKNPDIDDLQAFLSGELPFYMIPNHFIHVETIPLTPSGKIDRKALQIQGIRLNTAVDFEEPRDDIEERVAAIWKEILKLDRVGINDSFFSLGGNSINLIRVNTRLKELFNHDLPIIKMFEHFTIKSLSNYLKHLEKSSGDIESFVEKEIEGADAFQEKSLNIMEQTMQIIKGEKYD